MTTEALTVQLKVGDLVAKLDYASYILLVGTVVAATKTRVAVDVMRPGRNYAISYPRQWPNDWHRVTEAEAESLKALYKIAMDAYQSLANAVNSYPAGKAQE